MQEKLANNQKLRHIPAHHEFAESTQFDQSKFFVGVADLGHCGIRLYHLWLETAGDHSVGWWRCDDGGIFLRSGPDHVARQHCHHVRGLVVVKAWILILFANENQQGSQFLFRSRIAGAHFLRRRIEIFHDTKHFSKTIGRRDANQSCDGF
ncbi:MAG: hypothetical protein ACREDS_12660 [Limisphaerales bacterium]